MRMDNTFVRFILSCFIVSLRQDHSWLYRATEMEGEFWFFYVAPTNRGLHSTDQSPPADLLEPLSAGGGEYDMHDDMRSNPPMFPKNLPLGWSFRKGHTSPLSSSPISLVLGMPF